MFGKTHSTKTADIEKKWVVIDAKGLVVGRLASIIAMRLRGKHKPSFTPHMDDGDQVVIVNADKVVFTGRKRETEGLLPLHRLYRRHQGALGQVDPRGPVPRAHREKAVERMLPRGPLGRKQLGNLRVYKGPEHPHAAQQPEALDVASLNRKNSRSA